MTYSDQPEVLLFTDGACSGNPGPGGWAYILRHVGTGKNKEAFGAERETTNNRMELQAVIVPATNHLLTTGFTLYQDNSEDQRSTLTQTNLVGQVVLGARGPQPVVFPSLVPLGPPAAANPVRVAP